MVYLWIFLGLLIAVILLAIANVVLKKIIAKKEQKEQITKK